MIRIVAYALLLLSSVSAWAADVLPPVPSTSTPIDPGVMPSAPIAERSIGNRPNSIFVFGGALSTASIITTELYGLNKTLAKPYDNAIFGAAYNRDLWNLGYGFTAGAEVGLADRVGYYRVCCDTIVRSDRLLNSGELWSGFSVRYDSPLLFNWLRISPGLVGGLSATTDSIGREREREVTRNGSARLLFYLATEVAFSTPNWPVELVIRVHHRSGANGTLGRLMEGYNANLAGLRYRF